MARKQPLEDLWRTFRADVLTHATDEEIERARDTFFSGARAAVELVDIGDVPPSLLRELEDFERDVIQRSGGTH